MGSIYEIICWTTGLRYIGSTELSLNERLLEHKKPSNKLSSKYVIEHNNYEIYLLEKCDIESLKLREDFYILHTDCVNYRLASCGRKITLSNYNSSTKGKNTHKKYRQTDKCKNTQQKYRQTDTYKNYRKQKVLCECGIECLKINLKQHTKSKKHQEYLKT
jgi:hypothetical protein